ncbi:hypothetical protein [Shinella sp.]|uniref:hypothetical protein n=1 Tax=Shinella sp. TaxID=1870904 RepID=UPI004036D384
MPSTLQAQRDNFQAKIDNAKKHLAFNEDNDVRFWRVEGSGPQIDITEDINEDHRKLIESFGALVKAIDEMIAAGR